MLYNHTLGRAAHYFPNLTAAVDGERRLTFRQLSERVERLAARLLEIGFVAGDRLAFHLPNCLEFLELTYACARLGVIIVPMNTRYAPPEIDEVLLDSRPRGLVLHHTLPRPTVSAPWQIVVGEQTLDGSDGPVPEPAHTPDEIFGLFYTSGTTGRAKGVMLTHRNLLSNMLNGATSFRFATGDVFLHAAPMFHLADFPMTLSGPSFGITQVMVPRFDPRLVCEAISQERVTHSVLIPTMVNFLTQYPELARYNLSSLRFLLYGGSPMAPEIIRRAREKLPECRLRQGYGLSEASPLITVLEDEDHVGERLMSCGRPIPGVEVRIVDEQGHDVPGGERGEIVARGFNVMKGYWEKPEETRASFFGDWLRTGDIAREDEDGFYYIVDRRKDMIVTGGENVYSTEVEAAVYSHPAVREAAVIGVPDPQWGEAVMACVSLKDGAALTLDDLQEHCRALLANYKIPRRLEVCSPELPKSGTGKILKRELRAKYWQAEARGVH